jgi:hypothetical protein
MQDQESCASDELRSTEFVPESITRLRFSAECSDVRQDIPHLHLGQSVFPPSHSRVGMPVPDSI